MVMVMNMVMIMSMVIGMGIWVWYYAYSIRRTCLVLHRMIIGKVIAMIIGINYHNRYHNSNKMIIAMMFAWRWRSL